MTKYCRSKSFAFLLLWLPLLFQIAWGAPGPVASVIAGDRISVSRAGATAPLALRAPLFDGDVVITGPNGSAKLLFADGSQAKMRANSRLRILAPASQKAGAGLFQALFGEVWARLRPGRAVRTSHSNLVVRGTEFDLLVAADETATLTVIEGEVDFSNAQGAVKVGASQQSVARVGVAPTQPVTVANAGLIIEWTLDIENAALPFEKFFTSPNRAAALRLAKSTGNDVNAADALFDAGDFPGALARYEKLGNAPATQLRVGHALLALGRLAEAATAFRTMTASPADAASGFAGLAWAELKSNRPAAAQAAAQSALAAPGGAGRVETNLVAAITSLRQGKAAEAETRLRAALAAEPAAQRHQARAWLALLQLSRSQNETALSEARQAVQDAPDSALAQTSLATVGFFTGQTAEAARAAKRAVALNPDDMAAQLALAQSQLASGDADKAATAAARATALDPLWPQAHYVLGIADAGRRDYRHAANALESTLKLAPDFFPAVAALARVEVKMGREKQSLARLDAYQKAHGESDTVWSARGEVLHSLARYEEALAAHRKATTLRPTALNWNHLARTAIDYNHLAEAIEASEKAVALAPDIAAYHANLGLAFEFSKLDAQAERSYRTALALDPQNALALVKLGFLNKDSDPRTQSRTSGLAFAQGFLYDPAVSRDLLSGGILSQVAANGGPDNNNAELTHRVLAKDGNLNIFTRHIRSQDGGDRPNTSESNSSLRQDLTYQVKPGTSLYFHTQQNRSGGGLAGPESSPAADDHHDFRLNEGILAVRHKVRQGTLWAGAFTSGQRDRRVNPNDDRSMVFPFISGGSAITLNAPNQTQRTRTFSPEIRFDMNLGQKSHQPASVTLGLAQIETKFRTAASLILPGFLFFPPTPGSLTQRGDFSTSLAYAQMTKQVNPRLSVTGQMRYQSVDLTTSTVGALDDGSLSFDVPEATQSKRYLLPSFIANYQASPRSTVRLMASRRATDVNSSIFAPINTLLTAEDATMPHGLPDPSQGGDLRVVELDVEHTFAPGRSLKLFAFHSAGRHLSYDFGNFANTSDIPNSGVPMYNALPLDNVKRNGLGMRYEHQISRCLFGQFNLAVNQTKNNTLITFPNFATGTVDTVPAIYSGQVAPYHPKSTASMRLNYISPSGNKAGLNLRYTGAVFADTGDPLATTRPRLPGKVKLDVLLAREASVKSELFVGVTNVFDSQEFIFNGIPLDSRRVTFGITRRF